MNYTLQSDILLALSELGETPDTIRDSLFKLGIKGRQKTCQSCPIGKYLNSKMPGEDLAEWYRVVFSNSDYIARATREFISHFDLGHYPELISGAFPSNHATKTKDNNAP